MSFHFDHWEIEDNYPVIFTHRRKSLTKTPPLFDPNNCSPKKKKVRFSEKCSVVLIPSRQEYVNAGIQLWFNPEDQDQAKNDTMEEIRHIMDYNPMLSMPLALTYLYQPKFESNYAYHNEDSYFRDAKERLNILLIDTNHTTANFIKSSLKQILQPFNQFVLSIVHEENTEDAIERLQKASACAAVSSIDVILIQESIFLDIDDNSHFLEEDEDALFNLLTMIHQMHDEKSSSPSKPNGNNTGNNGNNGSGNEVLVGMIISDNKCSNRLKELGKRGSIDFVWKMPIVSYIPMLPLILNQRRSFAHSLPVFTSTLQSPHYHYSSPSSSSSSLNLLKKKINNNNNNNNNNEDNTNINNNSSTSTSSLSDDNND